MNKKYLLLQSLFFLLIFLIAGAASAANITYTYDSAGRLTHADHGSGRTIAYTYDNNGNLLQEKVGKGSIIITSSDISVNKSEINFSNVKINTPFESTIVIKNEGNGDLSITEVKITPDTGTDANEFSINNNYSKSIKPNDTTLISITFKPISEGAKKAALTITSNDPDENVVSVTLKGTGTKETSGGGGQTATNKSSKGGLCVISSLLNKKWINIFNVFKDKYLLISPHIKKFVYSYYRYSPSVLN
ncbi:choice-of-anchor D domain-containing protein [Candidatus Poribacteria bacterium]|nr:choice-of-anchor D domain-containing protein [Candidatus Poribacteria bacterium]